MSKLAQSILDSIPDYRSHKVVKAFKICSISPLPRGGADLHPVNIPITKAVTVSEIYLSKHKPKVGGYWVCYEDGYQSFSPADAFESGYAKINMLNQPSPTILRQPPSLRTVAIVSWEQTDEGHSKLVPDGIGYFHQFGTDYDTQGQIPVAIVERPTGEIASIPVELVTFSDVEPAND